MLDHTVLDMRHIQELHNFMNVVRIAACAMDEDYAKFTNGGTIPAGKYIVFISLANTVRATKCLIKVSFQLIFSWQPIGIYRTFYGVIDVRGASVMPNEVACGYLDEHISKYKIKPWIPFVATYQNIVMVLAQG